MADCNKTIPAIIPERSNSSITNNPSPTPSNIRKNETVSVSLIEAMFRLASEVPSIMSIAGMVSPARIEAVELNQFGI